MKSALFGIAVAALWLVSSFASAEEGERRDLSLTIYHPKDRDEDADYIESNDTITEHGFAVVRDTRRYVLKAGLNRDLSLARVASQMDETSVKLRSITNPKGFRLLSQSYVYDLPCLATLLDNSLEKPIVLFTDAGRFEGTLLDFDTTRMVIRSKDNDRSQIVALRGKNLARIALPLPPKGLRAKPTLLWDAEAAQPGPQDLSVSYVAQGIGWRTDYSLVIDETETHADLSAWATILNESGAAYENVTLKLVAGEVERETVEIERGCEWEWEEEVELGGGGTSYGVGCAGGLGKRSASLNIDGENAQFTEKSFFEYHLYTLPRPITIPENSSKQLELFPRAQNVAFSMIYRFSTAERANRGPSAPPKAVPMTVWAEFANSQANHLGLPLPKGKLRIFLRDGEDGTLDYVGEDVLKETPKDETVRIKLGRTFDVYGERRQVLRTRDAKNTRESVEIVLTNEKSKAVTVQVREILDKAKAIFEKNPDGFKRQGPTAIEALVTVLPGEQKTVSYTVSTPNG